MERKKREGVSLSEWCPCLFEQKTWEGEKKSLEGWAPSTHGRTYTERNALGSKLAGVKLPGAWRCAIPTAARPRHHPSLMKSKEKAQGTRALSCEIA